MTDIPRHDNCILCGVAHPRKLGIYYSRHGLVRCGHCGFVFMERIPTLEELNAHYSQYSYGRQEYISPVTIKAYHRLLDEFEPYRKNNRILDVGCGRGAFLVEALKRGWDAWGSEYSARAVEICREKGINMMEGQLDPALFDRKDFDVVTSFEVLEHMNEPHKEVTSIHTLLRSGGLFYCTTPNFNSLMRYYLKTDYNVIGYPEHLCYYTRPTMHKLMRMNGFRKLKFRSTGISVTRLQMSRNGNQKKFTAETSPDEKLRRDIERKWYLGMAKKTANMLLSATNTGLTLKGYYLKR